jgi:putative oxidoreductase
MEETALLILRLTVGLLLAGHGAQKLFGGFGGGGMQKHTQMTQAMGFRPAPFWAWLNVLAEFVGGLLMAVGLFTPVIAAVFVGVMIIAVVKVHLPKGLWNTNGGYEYNLVLIAASVVLGLVGPGALALDAFVPSPLPQDPLFIVSLIATLIGTAIGLAISARRTALRQRPM